LNPVRNGTSQFVPRATGRTLVARGGRDGLARDVKVVNAVKTVSSKFEVFSNFESS